MIVRVRLFAVAKKLAGSDMLQLDLPEGSTVADLRRSLAAAVPDLGAMLPQIIFAVDRQYAHDQTPLAASTDVACIPPVSGG